VTGAMRRFRQVAVASLLAATLALPAFAQGKSTVTTERVRAELLVNAPEGIQPGKTFWVGLQLSHQPEWHTYWKNSGDSGLPTQMQWTLPAGLSAGEIAWPLPRKIPIGNLANYGYEGTVLLPVPVKVAADFKPPVFGDVEVKLQANWLVCKKECIPEEGAFTVMVPARGSTAMNAAAFDAALKAQPKPLPANTGVIPDSTARIDGDALAVSVQGLPVEARGQTLTFLPETAEVIENGAAITQQWKGGEWTARVPLSPQRSASPDVMPVVLASANGGWRAELKVIGQWPQLSAATGVSPALAQALGDNARTPANPPVGFLAAVLLALVGGMVLNLMPCVFPVLAIKVLGYANQAKDRRGLRIGGMAYATGVLVSFLALGGLVLALRAAGEQLGWGFQLQSPAVVALLAALFTLIGLNLAGLFEFGAMLPSQVASFQARHPVVDAFLSGVLAVAIASPCTAPFMGASLGLAVTLPAFEALGIFAALGIGMALPYLVATMVPVVASHLPKPGAWMDVFRRFMAFPMFATVAWLVWVIGQQSGIDGAASLLALLVALAMVVWAFTLRGRARAALGAIAVASFALLAWTAGPAITRVQAAGVASHPQGPWQPWEPGRVEQVLASGQPVFVDFTAAWCVTCQYNKKTVLTNPQVLADFESRKVAMLRADWTRRDPAITAALSQLGRSGVPVYVFYKPGAAPVVLSEILGVEEVRSALAKL
jgi:thiol:disulfide interchange protein DsbD